MNGSRSAELTAADTILDSDASSAVPDTMPAPTSDVTSTSDQPGHSMQQQPELQHTNLQAFSDQARLNADADGPVYSHRPRLSGDAEMPLYSHQPRLSGDAGAHHRPAASWQQSEASMLEVASTSGSSSESGMTVRSGLHVFAFVVNMHNFSFSRALGRSYTLGHAASHRSLTVCPCKAHKQPMYSTKEDTKDRQHSMCYCFV